MGNTLFKNSQGYGYKYTDISEIHKWLEDNSIEYYQYIEPIDGADYVYTVPIINGEEMPPRRGCRVITASLSGKTNPAQEQGSGITYARRYSLLMAFGLATTDDDAACMTVEKAKAEKPKTEKPKNAAYPGKDFMISAIREHYNGNPIEEKKMLTYFKVSDIEELTNEQVAVVFNKVGGK